MSNDSIKKIMLVALGVCFVCSILVSTAAVGLRDRQEENKRLDRVNNILLAGDLLEDGVENSTIFEEKIQSVIIDLRTGEEVPSDQLDEVLNRDNFEVEAVAADAEHGEAIPSNEDIARIIRKPKSMLVYQVIENDELTKVILPIYGKGLWSTLYGFIALGEDLKTIQGLTFYEHGETPGLGGEVDNPRWKSSWKGKQAFGDDGEVIIEVIKGRVDNSRAEASHQIDGLSGSTLTTRGVDNLVKYWLGDKGYGNYLQKLREGSIHD